VSFCGSFVSKRAQFRSRRAITLCCVLAAVALSACSNVPISDPAKQANTSASSPQLAGRLIIKVAENGPQQPARSLSAHFELRGQAQRGALDLSTPLGSLLAQARWEPEAAWLRTPRGETRFDNLDTLSQKLLGQTVPVAALFDWLRARPWAGAPHQAVDVAESGFTQIGWRVDVSRWAKLSVVTAIRLQAPTVTVSAQLERP
jgi:outer membrane lipoprotein LolB